MLVDYNYVPTPNNDTVLQRYMDNELPYKFVDFYSQLIERQYHMT